MAILLSASGLFLLLATLLPLVRSEKWWIRGFDFPRMQLAFLLLAVFTCSLFVFNPSHPPSLAFLLALAAAGAWQAIQIAPYTPLVRPQTTPEPSCGAPLRIRLLTANVLMDNRRADDFLTIVRAHDPDVVIAVETDSWWDGRLAALDRDYPFSIKHPLGNTYGIHLFSKLALEQPEVRFLVDDDVPSIRTEVRLRSGASIDLYAVHPKPPRPGRDTDQRDAELLIVGTEVRERGRPAIVAGDLNDVAWSHTTRLFQRISGMLDPRVGRGPYSTFHARYPGFRWALDHIFHDASFTFVDMQRLGYFGSDHFPVLIVLCHRPGAAQKPPQPGPGDHEEAAEKIEEGQEAGSAKAEPSAERPA